MKNVEKELTRENLESYKKDGFISREKITSKSDEEVICESKLISKKYHKIDWKKVFEEKVYKRKNLEDLDDSIDCIIVNDKKLGMFRINDMGENYMIFCKLSWTDEDRLSLVTILNKHGIVCEILNKNLINVVKQKL